METIMIQEADPATLDVVTTALQMEGYRVCGLTDDQENALELIRRHRPKMVLVDCWPSSYSGKQVSHWVKTHFPQLPVIAFSCDNRIEENYRQFGFDHYIKKPFDLELLYQVVRKYTRAHARRKRSANPI
jgi:DNA-binding response OmpR family regulator